MSIKYWDPAGVDLENVQNPDYLLKQENFVKKYYSFILYTALTLNVVLFAYMYYKSGELELPIFYFIKILAIILIVAYFYLTNLRKKLIKYKIAKKNEWLYSPVKNRSLYNKYAKQFPKAFHLDSKGGYFESVFWGNNSKDNKGYDFVLGDFSYVIKKGRNQNKYTDHFFIMRLNTDISVDFFLETKTFSSKVSNFFGKQDIVTESLDFNKSFDFFYEKNGTKVKLDILSVLSPVVLEQIVHFNNKKKRSYFTFKNTRVFFKKDCVIFISPSPLLDTKGSIKASSIQIKEKDELEVKKEMQFFFDIATKISDSLTRSKYWEF